MSEAGKLVHLLRNIPTLKSVLEAVGWTVADAKRLGLIS